MSLLSFFLKPLPWEKEPSIFKFIQSHITKKGDLDTKSEDLPDENKRFKEGDLRWAPGAMDGAFGHHAAPNNNQETAVKVANLLKEIAETNSTEKKIEFYNLVTQNSVIDYVDLAVDEISKLNVPINYNLRQYIRNLLYKGADREVVKFAIVILGFIGTDLDLEDVKMLGLHDEFTLYSAVAMMRRLNNPLMELWDLGKHINGWGRVHIVERLAGMQDLPPQLQDWLLREGFKNEVMYEYLACICARAGKLKEILEKGDIDDELFQSIGTIITTLIRGNGGPAEGMMQYEDEKPVLENYIKLLEKRAATLNDFLAAHFIYNYMNGAEEYWENNKAKGLDKELRKNIAERVEKIIKQNKWKTLIETKRNTKDEHEFYEVSEVSRILDINIWETYWKRLQEEPKNSTRWFFAMNEMPKEYLHEALDLANKTFSFADLMTGPADEVGMGTHSLTFNIVDSILHGLEQHPGEGIEFIKLALKSPVTRNRNGALGVLSRWKLTDEVKQIVEEAKVIEPNEDTKKWMENILKGDPLRP